MPDITDTKSYKITTRNKQGEIIISFIVNPTPITVSIKQKCINVDAYKSLATKVATEIKREQMTQKVTVDGSKLISDLFILQKAIQSGHLELNFEELENKTTLRKTEESCFMDLAAIRQVTDAAIISLEKRVYNK